MLRISGGGFRLAVETILAPVFHCHAVLARLRLPDGTSRQDLVAALRRSDEVRIAGGRDRATPAERAGEPGIMLTEPRPAGDARSFWIWAVADNLISGTALNAVRIAEAVVAQGRAGGKR